MSETLIGIKKGDLYKVPMQIKKTWKEANKGYLICQEYDKIQPSEWFKISDKIQEMEIDFDGVIDISTHVNNSNSFGWCYNLKGFIPYRYMIDNKTNIE